MNFVSANYLRAITFEKPKRPFVLKRMVGLEGTLNFLKMDGYKVLKSPD